MKWHTEFLIIGFIVENILILLMGLDGAIKGNWWFLFLIPVGIWLLELLRRIAK